MSSPKSPAAAAAAIVAVPASPARAALVDEGLAVAVAALERGALAEADTVAQGLAALAPDAPRVWGLRARVLRAAGQEAAADAAEQEGIRRMAARIAGAGRPLSLRQRMQLFSTVTFLGGPPSAFVELGQMQLMVMLEHGLARHHKVADVGCGALRAGLWLMRVLDPGGYHGIEPHQTRLRFGIDHVVGAAAVAAAQARFDSNDRFDLSVFGTRFDFVVARSVWTHAAKVQIAALLDSFVAHGAPGATLLASYLPATDPAQDHQGAHWVGRSATSSVGGLIRHDPAWIAAECGRRGLGIAALDHHIVNGQVWLKITQHG